MNKPFCGNCKFWDSDWTVDSWGRCKRRSPHMVYGLLYSSSNDEEIACWPRTWADDHCFEYEPSEERVSDFKPLLGYKNPTNDAQKRLNAMIKSEIREKLPKVEAEKLLSERPWLTDD